MSEFSNDREQPMRADGNRTARAGGRASAGGRGAGRGGSGRRANNRGNSESYGNSTTGGRRRGGQGAQQHSQVRNDESLGNSVGRETRQARFADSEDHGNRAGVESHGNQTLGRGKKSTARTWAQGGTYIAPSELENVTGPRAGNRAGGPGRRGSKSSLVLPSDTVGRWALGGIAQSNVSEDFGNRVSGNRGNDRGRNKNRQSTRDHTGRTLEGTHARPPSRTNADNPNVGKQSRGFDGEPRDGQQGNSASETAREPRRDRRDRSGRNAEFEGRSRNTHREGRDRGDGGQGRHTGRAGHGGKFGQRGSRNERHSHDRFGGAGNGSERLNKVLSQAGVGSRRGIDSMIEQGAVKVNGVVATLGMQVSATDNITVNDRPIRFSIGSSDTRVLLYHKPVGEIVSRDDPEGRPTVFRKLPRLRGQRWVAVGRLDYNTEGLLIFTTNGELANRFMHPRYEVAREYAVRVVGELDDWSRERLLNGVDLDGEICKFEAIEDRGGEAVNRWHHVLIREGKNREVRRLFEGVGLTVSRLIRVRFGAIALPPQLKRGMMRELDASEVTQLMNIHRMDEPGLQGPTRRLLAPDSFSEEGKTSFDTGATESADFDATLQPLLQVQSSETQSDEMPDGFAAASTGSGGIEVSNVAHLSVDEALRSVEIDAEVANTLINSERAFSPADDGDLDASPEELPQAFTARTPRGQRMRHEKKRRDVEPRAIDAQYTQPDGLSADGQQTPDVDSALDSDSTLANAGDVTNEGERRPRGRRNNSNQRGERNRGSRERRDARSSRAFAEPATASDTGGAERGSDLSQGDGAQTQARGNAGPAARDRKPRASVDGASRSRKPRDGATSRADTGTKKPRSGKAKNKANFADDNIGNRVGGKKGKSLLGVDARGAGKGKPGRKKKGEKDGEVSIAKLFSRGKELVIPAAPEEVKPKKRSLANVKAYIEGDGNAVGTIRLRKRDSEE